MTFVWNFQKSMGVLAFVILLYAFLTMFIPITVLWEKVTVVSEGGDVGVNPIVLLVLLFLPFVTLIAYLSYGEWKRSKEAEE